MIPKSAVMYVIIVVWGVMLFGWVVSTGWRTYPIPEDWHFIGAWVTSALVITLAIESFWKDSVEKHNCHKS